MRCSLRLVVIIAIANAGSTAFAQTVVYENGFENSTLKRPPEGWVQFHRNSSPTVSVEWNGHQSNRSLLGRRSDARGWSALSREFEAQSRVMIEFSFAFSDTAGRSLNVWTHEPDGTDASQFNVCIQNGALMQYDGRSRSWIEITRKIVATKDPAKPVWHRLRAVVDADEQGIDFWISQPHQTKLPEQPVTRAAYRTEVPIGAIDFVSGNRIAEEAWYRIDDLVIKGGLDLPAPGNVAPPTEPFRLWTGDLIPRDPNHIPWVAGIDHQTIHRATADGYKFLHGAALTHHKGVMYATWANSPINENGPHETMQGRRSLDDGRTWSEVEVVAPGFEGPDRHSHGILFVHDDRLWTIAARWGTGTDGRKFRGLVGEAFVLNEETDSWESRGSVMDNCWPYDQPDRMANGNYITGGQDKNGLPVVAISNGNDMTKWTSVLIPYDPRLQPSYAETSVLAEGKQAIAVIRGGGGVAWVSVSEDCGRTWSIAGPSNYPMPRAKPYLGKLSTGQRYLLSNFRNRDTLVIAVGKPGETTFRRMYRIRHGKSVPPRFKGKSKFKQWSYPYGYEHDGKLYVVYSIGKEDCGLSVMPLSSLVE